MSGPASPLARWLGPAAIIWTSLMLSAWVHTHKLSPKVELATPKLLLLFLAVPVLQVVALGLLRRLLAPRPDSRGAEVMILWLMTFLFGLHAALLATAVGLIPSVARAVPVAISLLMLGIAPAVAYLEPNSPLGIRTKATLAHPETWRATHRFAALCFGVAGLLAPIGLALPGLDGLSLAILPAVMAVALGIIKGVTAKPPPGSEDPGASTRP